MADKATIFAVKGILFLGGCLAAYLPARENRQSAISDAEFRLSETEKEIRGALAERDELISRLQSQDDPAWIEIVLMRDLGVVPDGWIKVHFTK
jgi:hypothetical protein